jgi:hypothetical protein
MALQSGALGCARVSRPRTVVDRQVSRICETYGRWFRRGRETCAERGDVGRIDEQGAIG